MTSPAASRCLAHKPHAHHTSHGRSSRSTRPRTSQRKHASTHTSSGVRGACTAPDTRRMHVRTPDRSHFLRHMSAVVPTLQHAPYALPAARSTAADTAARRLHSRLASASLKPSPTCNQYQSRQLYHRPFCDLKPLPNTPPASDLPVPPTAQSLSICSPASSRRASASTLSTTRVPAHERAAACCASGTAGP